MEGWVYESAFLYSSTLHIYAIILQTLLHDDGPSVQKQAKRHLDDQDDNHDPYAFVLLLPSNRKMYQSEMSSIHDNQPFQEDMPGRIPVLAPYITADSEYAWLKTTREDG
jgi:hypothetical protein